MQITSISFDISNYAGQFEKLKEAILSATNEAIDSGSSIVCLPELLWFASFTKNTKEEMVSFAQSFWKTDLPQLVKKIPSNNCFLLLGTAPGLCSKGNLRNRAVIINKGQIEFQDKLYLTPWETMFSEGRNLNIYDFQDIKLALNICFDVEQPEIAALLKQSPIDLLLVPSATETELGVERVTRSASSRAVELGCAVTTTHLIGTSQCELIDNNYGRVGIFYPSQSLFAEAQREQITPIANSGTQSLSFSLPMEQLRQQKLLKEETNPILAQKEKPISVVSK